MRSRTRKPNFLWIFIWPSHDDHSFSQKSVRLSQLPHVCYISSISSISLFFLHLISAPCPLTMGWGSCSEYLSCRYCGPSARWSESRHMQGDFSARRSWGSHIETFFWISFLQFVLVAFLYPPVGFHKSCRNSYFTGNSPFFPNMIVSSCQILKLLG